MNVLVITETDKQDQETTIIGIADSVDIAEKLISEYYGKHEQLEHNDVRDCSIECSKVLEVTNCFGEPYEVVVWFEWFGINEV